MFLQRILKSSRSSRSLATTLHRNYASRPSIKEKNFLYQKLGKQLMEEIPLESFKVYKNELAVTCTPSTLLSTLEHLKTNSAYKFAQMVDITAVDYPTRVNRFELVYMMLSIEYSTRIIVKVEVGELTPVPSCVGLFAGANWMERDN
jgi:NADH dehydrogenase (ubiquinone) Fe-S protein 3